MPPSLPPSQTVQAQVVQQVVKPVINPSDSTASGTQPGLQFFGGYSTSTAQQMLQTGQQSGAGAATRQRQQFTTVAATASKVSFHSLHPDARQNL